MKRKCVISFVIFLIIMLCGIQVRAADTEPQELESTKYIIDETNKIIYRVIPETDVETFKSNFTISEQVKLYKDSKCEEEVTSGIVATGMALKNLTDNAIYEISTIGDFDGDGKIGQVELTNLIRHVVGLQDYQLTGIVEKSADFNNDNKLSIIDITILIRYIVYGELDIPENQAVASPEIEVVSGTEGTNDWYTSNVGIRITPKADESIIDRTTYKISGTKQVEETEIAANETITLEQGTYQISAYTYSKDGFKSLATRRTIKIDTTKPQTGKLNMWLDEENGAEYTSDTWTTHNVVISLENGIDKESGHLQTTYSLNNGENTTEPASFTENGVYNIKVESIDNAGNKATSDYVIKIDKNAIPAPQIKVISGEKNEGSDWYKSDSVVLEVTNDADMGDGSKIVKHTYTIEGTRNQEETEVDNAGRITIAENGTFTITAYSYNEAGKRSDGTKITIKKDNTVPEAPKLEVISGNKAENSEWYVDNVTLKVTQAVVNEPLSPISKITYKIDGANQVAETEIANEGTIKITKDGVSTITVYNYNEAGTRSEPTTLVIQKDSVNPNVSKVTAKDINIDSFKLVGEAEDETSGIITYEFYLNDKLINTVNTNVKQVEITVEGKKPGKYKAYIIAKDAAGHTTKSDVIDIQTARLTIDEVDYFEFVVTGFTITNGSEAVEEGAVATVSDTSLTSNPKYIMVNSSTQNVKGSVAGKIRLVCKDGTVVEDLDFFPAELTINMEYYANGSGSSFTHENEANFFGKDLNSAGVGEGETTQTNIVISNSDIGENKFIVEDQKLTGTQTYTRTTINSITLNGESLLFRIVQE